MMQIPTGLIHGNSVLVDLLRRSIYRALRSHDYSADQQHLIVADGVRELCNAGAYVDCDGRLQLPEWTIH